MKKLFWMLTFLIAACDRPLQKYIIKVHGQSLDIVTRNLVPSEKIDTIMSENDTEGYEQGLIKYFAGIKTDEELKKRRIVQTSITTSFEVEDANGANLEIKLKPKVIDSLTKYIKRVALKTLN